ncbi:unnamed protein product [Candidula unifasciata]|uniref:Surfeit locus protein 2 n=1 Tax=Candidula unifasciata TaxID=100452 RepID=A0A8S3YVH3_9EUPU|nr:unnamed protein product [Candidula unifasciata]
MASSEVQRFLDEYSSLKYDKDKQKVTCGLTKHEMPATAAAIESYVKGRKFKNAFKKDSYNYDQHKPHIVASNKKRHLHELFCSLTLRHIARTPEAVERHVKGKRFRRALARWQSCQETGERFMPRGGQRNSNKATVSDNDSIDGGDDFWMNDSDDEVPNDDMSDLYPAHLMFMFFSPPPLTTDLNVPGSEPEGDVDDDRGKSVPTKKLKPVKAKQVNVEDSDSDYDMAVLDEVTIEVSTPQLVVPSQNKRKKKKKKQKETLPAGSSDAKKKKLS